MEKLVTLWSRRSPSGIDHKILYVCVVLTTQPYPYTRYHRTESGHNAGFSQNTEWAQLWVSSGVPNPSHKRGMTPVFEARHGHKGNTSSVRESTLKVQPLLASPQITIRSVFDGTAMLWLAAMIAAVYI